MVEQIRDNAQLIIPRKKEETKAAFRNSGGAEEAEAEEQQACNYWSKNTQRIKDEFSKSNKTEGKSVSASSSCVNSLSTFKKHASREVFALAEARAETLKCIYFFLSDCLDVLKHVKHF